MMTRLWKIMITTRKKLSMGKNKKDNINDDMAVGVGDHAISGNDEREDNGEDGRGCNYRCEAGNR